MSPLRMGISLGRCCDELHYGKVLRNKRKRPFIDSRVRRGPGETEKFFAYSQKIIIPKGFTEHFFNRKVNKVILIEGG